MSAAMTGQRQASTPEAFPAAIDTAESSGHWSRPRAQRTAPAQLPRNASDDEILDVGTSDSAPRASASLHDANANPDENEANAFMEESEDPLAPTDQPNGALPDARMQSALDSIPELRQAWQDARSYRESFATPEEARAATALLNDLNRMDALFFSRSAEAHAKLAQSLAKLDPDAFASLAKAMNSLAANRADTPPGSAANVHQVPPIGPSTPTPAQVEFLHAANAATVQGVLDAIETQVERLLPEGVSKTARNRVVGEIYRELDASLGSNRQLTQQMREALRSGSLDAAHQRAIVSLVTGRARQALPGIAKRVLNEWTSTVIAANQDRLARQRTAAHRVDIAGSGRSGDGGRRSLAPRDIDYGRMSDSDILNL